VTRAGGRAGDDLWVSGQPGRAALGLAALRGETSLLPGAYEACVGALQRPQPRVALGGALRGLASAMLDVSDGLLGDLRHILECSATGAVVDVAALPLAALHATGTDPALCRHCLLSGGDDYELLFAAPFTRRADVAALATRLGLPLHRIGHLSAEPGQLRLRESDGNLATPTAYGYDHFG
jgi:thiamine-monophosphate kinase